ncbi:hypothetical protein CPLU01_09376 [Colletotrichum plurivorum]|uniref:Uncharacterized protein n=1 Tax=Colletotrichum plurivorum TaxID=2175906 RepID=A0A8H6K906_9PEZI|nr:hypothetical protein CPLU01_09376 [Colletotrichum plurivorum]
MLVHLRPEAIIAIVGVIVTIAVALPQLIPAATKGINAIRSWNRPHILPLYAPSPEVAANSAANLATELYSVLVSVPARVKTRVGEGLQAGFRVTRDPLAQPLALPAPTPWIHSDPFPGPRLPGPNRSSASKTPGF